MIPVTNERDPGINERYGDGYIVYLKIFSL